MASRPRCITTAWRSTAGCLTGPGHSSSIIHSAPIQAGRSKPRRTPNSAGATYVRLRAGARGRSGSRRDEGPIRAGVQAAPQHRGAVAPEEGFEPPTQRLTAACSTTELLRNALEARTGFEPVYTALQAAA